MTALAMMRKIANITVPVTAQQRNGLSWLICDAEGYVVAERMSEQQAFYVAELLNWHARKAAQEDARG